MQDFTLILWVRRRIYLFPVCLRLKRGARSSVHSFISVRLHLSDRSVQILCHLGQMFSPSLLYFTIVHHSWGVRAAVGHRNAY